MIIQNCKNYLFLIICLAAVLFTACDFEYDLGLGESIDLEAPELVITSPEKNAQVHTNTVLEGTCTDNTGVTQVVVTNNETGAVLGNASISGNKWSYNAILSEGEVTLRVTAYDYMGNNSTKSSKTISLLVDDSAPEGLTWYVDRGNSIQVGLKSLAELTSLKTNLSVNKDIPQNESFTIYGHLYDAMSIAKVTLTLTENGNTVIQKTVLASSLGDNQSIYTPSFSFTHDELTEKDAALASGKHYFQVSYTSEDEHGNIRDSALDYMLWYPESDNPGIEQTQTSDDEDSLTINIGSAIPFTFFDDDGLAEVYYKILDTNAVINASTLSNNLASLTKITVDGKRDYPMQIPSSETERTGKKYLAAYAVDIKGKVNQRFITVNIVDASFPILIIESPNENAVPSIKAGTTSTFEIVGYCNDTNGSSQVQIVYIPESSTYDTSAKKEERAKQIFNNTSVISSSSGEILKTVTFNSDKSSCTKSGKFVQEPFTFDFDVLNDFGSQGKDPKFFELMVEDTEHNKTYKQFRVDGDSVAPEIVVSTPNDGAVCDYRHNNLVIKYKAVKNSGLGINSTKYKIVRKDDSTLEYTLNSSGTKLIADGDYVSLTIDKDTVKDWAEGLNGNKANTQPVFILYAEDVLENSVTKQLSVILSPLPTLESISSDKADGTYKAGDRITIQTKFSDSVKVTGSPRLKISFTSDTSTEDGYAVYTSGTNSNTLTFTFTVPQGKSSDKIYCGGIDLNSGKIETAGIGTGDAGITVPSGCNLQDTNTIAFDGILPVINSIGVSSTVTENADGNYYVPSDKFITITLNCSENIFVSGSPVLVLSTANGDVNFNFQSLEGKKVIFQTKVSSATKNGQLKYDYSSLFSASDLLKLADEAGNTLSAGTGIGNLTCYIDTEVPSEPVMNLTGAAYNTSQTLILSGIEDGASPYYSKDGISFEAYTTSPAIVLGKGTYRLAARQMDKAGNISVVSTYRSVTINDTFPAVSGISIAKADGYYPAGTKIDFKLFLEDFVKVASADSATLTFTEYGKSTPERTVKVTAKDSTNTLVFSYIVDDGDSDAADGDAGLSSADEFNGIQIKSITLGSGVTDSYGNTAGSVTTVKIAEYLAATDCKRSGIVLDASRPSIKSDGFAPAKNAVSTSENSAFTITLTFNENIYKESGYVTLQRAGDWAIPPVLTADEFSTIYNNASLTDADKQILYTTDAAGDGVLDAKTGISIGPYKKITHGLKESGGYFVPDTATKYVLDFNLGIYDGSTVIDPAGVNKTVKVSDIRSVLAKTGYHQHKLDINSSQITITDNVMKIAFADTIEDGQQWELLIDSTALRDGTGNTFAGLASGDYKLWSNNVAVPVVRANRYSHGYGAKGLNSSGEEVEIDGYVLPLGKQNLPDSAVITGSNGSGRTLAPKGKCDVRIDCETPGAKIYYTTVSASSTDFASIGKTKTENLSSLSDVSASDLKITSGGTEYSAILSVGDGKYTTAGKDYVTAYAEKSGMTSSSYGYEGIFKTTIIFMKKNSDMQINVEGGTAKGGVPNVDGFPVRDAPSDFRYSKNAYYFTDSTGIDKNTYEENGQTKTDLYENYFAWVSYDIVSTNWAVLQHRDNYSSDYPTDSYGQLLYLKNYSSWE